MLNEARHFRPSMRQAHGLGAVEAAGAGASANAVRYTMGRAQALAEIDKFTGESGSTVCTYTTATNNASLVQYAVSNALAERIPGVTGAQLRRGDVKVNASALTTADRESVAKSAAERFFTTAHSYGGENAEIITGEATQRPPASYCVSS